eukprot:superscaffoldBa00001355_g10204
MQLCFDLFWDILMTITKTPTNSPPILPCNLTEAEDLSDSFVSGDEDNGRAVIANKNINNEINGNWLSSSSNSIHEARLKAKAKRRLRKNSSRDSGRGDSLSDNGDVVRGTSAAPTSPKSKLLDRKSRLGKGRGLPKKELPRQWSPELLAELNLGPMRCEVPSLAVSLALEAKASHRELTSRLLADLCGPVLFCGDMEKSFDKLLRELPDLVLDTPGAPQLVGQFIARAVSDQILSKSYIEGYKGRVDCEYTRFVIFGSAVGGFSFLCYAVTMNLLLKEYILSGDSKEAERCLRDLEVPHFHHEFVYEAIVMVLESKGEKTFKMVQQLLKSLSVSSIITVDQMRRGYERVYMDIAEINIDVPRAYFILEQFVDKSFSMGIIDEKLRDLCPCRGRKRFVSEGDGGVVKLESY